MESDLKQQLRLVDQELHQVQDQIQSLLQHQESLLEQQAELQQLIASCRDVAAHDENGNGPGASKSGGVNWSGSFEWDNRAADIRLNLFGIKSYRQNQHEIINAVMSGRDVIVIMAAGGGKSLCYQLPAMLRTGTALVISPLLSLIQDQVMGLTALGISASMLTSTTTKDEEKSIYKSLEKGEGDLKILYVTPEKVAKSKRFVSKLEKCNHGGRLSLIAIDEAHCCSQWGHDFRPDYKQLGILKKQFPRVPMIALTATATERVQTDLREMLQITRCEKFVSTVNRPNLFYEVREKKANGSAAIDDIASFILDKYSKKESGIVYCFSRKECEQVAAELRKRGISAAHYHADMKPETRSSVHMRWSTNKLQVIVGTVAFGMGINKPDVRFVIHHSLSKSLETYYQESGRAGRDGLPAHCLLYFRPADLPRQSSMVFAEMAGLHNLYAICRFCQSKQACRRAAFFRHFGEKIQKCNGMCDNCAFTKEVVDTDVTEHARSLVSMVKESNDVEQKLTILQLVEQWRSQTKKSECYENRHRRSTCEGSK
ncbi:ATP-dependent DNA helicase Q-like 2 isoform X2 [Physcomitrium patens]|uniref:ATP-dependent DNA helicase Q-like 2 isoform X2 n=1 Tax=Physcomitrium patens TaxID=3218 RepID=UPI003CCE2496